MFSLNSYMELDKKLQGARMSTGMKTNLSFGQFLNKVVNGLVIIGMGYVVVATFLQVVFRYVLNHSLAWTDETSRYVFVWVTFLGAAVAVKGNKLIAVDFFESRLLSVKVRYFLCIIRQIVVGIYVVLMIWYGIVLTYRVSPDLSPAIEISMAFPYLGVPIGGCGMLYYVLLNLGKTIKMVAKGNSSPAFLSNGTEGDS
jgi:TRAP-type C4-dicarboxylate transport system permease small subunit